MTTPNPRRFPCLRATAAKVRAASTVLFFVLAATLAALGCSGAPEPPAPGPELAVDFNRQVLEVAEAEDRFLTLKGMRTAAMMHLAVHDALNAIDRRYEPYRWDGDAPEAPFPSYPSAHGTACAAAMTVLADVFGDRPVTLTIPEVDAAGPLGEKVAMDPPTRSFPSFSVAAEECSLSRVYLGIHFRYDSVEGTKLGRRIGEYAVGGFLRPAGDGEAGG